MCFLLLCRTELCLIRETLDQASLEWSLSRLLRRQMSVLSLHPHFLRRVWDVMKSSMRGERIRTIQDNQQLLNTYYFQTHRTDGDRQRRAWAPGKEENSLQTSVQVELATCPSKEALPHAVVCGFDSSQVSCETFLYKSRHVLPLLLGFVNFISITTWKVVFYIFLCYLVTLDSIYTSLACLS